MGYALRYNFNQNRPVSIVVKNSDIVVAIPGFDYQANYIEQAQCRQQLSTAAMFLWRWVAQALSRENLPRHLLPASA